VVISFTIETNGRLPSEETLADAIQATDAATDGYPLHYMVNCAHPTHFDVVLDDGPWLDRIRGLRANASTKSHTELDGAAELDRGDPDDLAARYTELGHRLPALHVIGGCCGTDHHHVEAIAHAFTSGR
jgi:S-methylmethionine-dependent homocysteine/selenocysteine methylase